MPLHGPIGVMLAVSNHVPPLTRSNRWLTCFACSTLLLLADCEAGQGEREPSHPVLQVNVVAPEIDAVYVSGNGPRTLADARGRVVLVDFWATYCGPCRRSFPEFQELLDGFGDDLAVIAVNIQEEATAADLTTFAAETGANFTILSDKDGVTRARFGPSSLPTAYILDREGQVRFVHPKYEGGDASKMALEIRSLIQQESSTRQKSRNDVKGTR